MPLVVGVAFRKVGKVYYFDPGEFHLHEGDFIIAETARGVEFGEVVLEPREVSEDELVAPLKKIVRIATGEDLQREAANRDREKHAIEVCERKIREHGLPMKLLDAEYAFDGSQVTFSFSADGRVDFRELVKDVASSLKTKVQLHQIGVRDEAKLIGGYGTCGRSLCCATFLSAFEPISMKMAKDQSLFLNPAKFSGACGKLMCCLRYEHDYYKQAQKRYPAVGAILQLEKTRAKVLDVNVINGMLTVQTEDDVQLHIPACQVNMEGLCRRHGIGCSMTERNCQPLSAGDYVASPVDTEEDDANEDLDLGADPTLKEIAEMADDACQPADGQPAARPSRRDDRERTGSSSSGDADARANGRRGRTSTGSRDGGRKQGGRAGRRSRNRSGDGRRGNGGNGRDNGGRSGGQPSA